MDVAWFNWSSTVRFRRSNGVDNGVDEVVPFPFFFETGVATVGDLPTVAPAVVGIASLVVVLLSFGGIGTKSISIQYNTIQSLVSECSCICVCYTRNQVDGERPNQSVVGASAAGNDPDGGAVCGSCGATTRSRQGSKPNKQEGRSDSTRSSNANNDKNRPIFSVATVRTRIPHNRTVRKPLITGTLNPVPSRGGKARQNLKNHSLAYDRYE